jgi:hypothetical protein
MQGARRRGTLCHAQALLRRSPVSFLPPSDEGFPRTLPLAFSQKHAGAGFAFWANVSLCRVGGDVTVTSESGKGPMFTVPLPGAAT